MSVRGSANVRQTLATVLLAGALIGCGPGVGPRRPIAAPVDAIADPGAIEDSPATPPDLIAADAPVTNDASADIDTQTQDAPVPIAADATWAAPAWSSVCVPAGTTAMTVGPVAPPPNQCLPHDCAECGPVDQCTCDGDGNTPCAWKPIAPLPFPVQDADHAWGDGKLYLFGGRLGTGVGYPTKDPFKYYGILQTAEIWDPVTDTWKVTPHAPVYVDDDLATAAFGGGKLYVGGANVPAAKQYNTYKSLPWGPDFADYAAYDPGTDSWTALPKQGSPGGCGGFAAMAFVGGKLIVAGCAGKFSWPPLTPAEFGVGPPAAFDPVTNAWEPLPAIPAGLLVIATSRALLSGADFGFLNRTVVKGVTTSIDLVVFHGAAWSWSVHPGPPCGDSEYPVMNQGGFDGGFIFVSQDVAPYAHIWWKASETWELVPMPKWFTPVQHVSPVWNGSEFLLWTGLKTWHSAAYNPNTRTWRQMAEYGQPVTEGGMEVATHLGARGLSIGGEFGQSTVSYGAGILVPPPQ